MNQALYEALRASPGFVRHFSRMRIEDRSIAILRGTHPQGMIFWDLKGEGSARWRARYYLPNR